MTPKLSQNQMSEFKHCLAGSLTLCVKLPGTCGSRRGVLMRRIALTGGVPKVFDLIDWAQSF